MFFSLEPPPEHYALTNSNEKYIEYEWYIPQEIRLFADDGGEEVFGIWLPETGNPIYNHPIIVVGELPGDEGCMGVVGTNLISFLRGWSAFHLIAQELDESKESAFLDTLEVPQSLRAEHHHEDPDENFAQLRKWADPLLPDPAGSIPLLISRNCSVPVRGNKMIRFIGLIVVLIGLLVTSGCITIAGVPTIHPHSEVMAPTFCLLNGTAEPAPIEKIWVYSYKDGPQKNMWILEYVPAPSQPSVRPFSCITYGKVPPGYREKAAALPLLPERFYQVRIERWDNGVVSAELSFIIRLGPSGAPVKLQYSSGRYRYPQVITQP